MGELDRGLEQIDRAIGKGYFPVATLSQRTQFDALRSRQAFQALLAAAQAGRARALTAFRDAGGERLLGA